MNSPHTSMYSLLTLSAVAQPNSIHLFVVAAITVYLRRDGLRTSIHVSVKLDSRTVARKVTNAWVSVLEAAWVEEAVCLW